MTRDSFRARSICAATFAFLGAVGCSTNGDSSSSGSGGGNGSGGSTATGGKTGTGSGGSPGSGGSASGTGGAATGTGGAATGSGGANIGTGGAVTGTAGKTGTGSGGAPAGTGGTPGTGGASATGGTPGTGGVPGTGGSPATGSCAPPTTGHYRMENIDRGVVAVKVAGGVYVGWRMMGYEYTPSNPTGIAYNVYRAGTKIATVTNSTNYLDASGTTSSTYTVSAVISGTECPQSPSVKTWAQNYLSIPISAPAASPTGATYSANDGSPGDLDGDGVYDIVLKWDPSDSKDNSQAGATSDVFLDGYTLAGKRLWRIDLGPNIRAGAHYTQFSVYDFDGDGKAEVACKTAPGTKDGTGAYLSKGPAANDDDSAKYANSDGYVLTGPEYLTVFDGATGKELSTVNYPVPRGTVSSWGDAYGNRVDRFNGGFAFVKDAGVASGLPSIIQGRGYYTRLTISALTYRNGALANNWIYDSVTSLNPSGAGDHTEMAADTDGDLGQEIITGQTTISSTGKLQCQSGMGHGDALDVSELIPGKGFSVFSIHEGEGGMDAHDAATCSFYFHTTEPGVDSNRGRAEYVGPGNENGASCACTSCDVKQVLCATGAAGGPSPGSNFVIYWDADEWRELENATSITKAGGGTLLNATGCASNNGSKATPTLTADILGDWREEIVYRTADNSALRVYTTTDVTARRIYTLMHDPTYRAQVSFEQSAYNQPPHPGFRISPNMADPPKPDIYVK